MAIYRYDYPRPALTVDVVIFGIQDECLQVLLIKRGEPPFKGSWALPGGFVNMDESLEEAAVRELAEETGVQSAYLEQLYTYGNPGRDPRGRTITVAYFALIPSDHTFQTQAGSDAEGAGWFPQPKLPELAFDHAEIIAYGLRRLRYKLEYSAVAFELVPEEFTLGELQRTYEIILGEKIDKRNFRRKIRAAQIVEATNRKRTGGGRPASLYRYRSDAVAEVKTRRLFP